ncbi:MAG: hypothetical protein KDD35_01360 [Bdellovibrionales bacterium]|nr:hypothetical protein [Bdellovibrionales bacterium]
MLSSLSTRFRFFKTDGFIALGLFFLGSLLFFWVATQFESTLRPIKDGYCRPIDAALMVLEGSFFPRSLWLPLTHWLTILLRPFTSSYYQAGSAVAILSGGGTISALYLFGNRLGGRTIGLMTSMIAVSLWPLIDVSSHSMTEPLSLFLVLMGILFFCERRFCFSGGFLSLACLVRIEPLVVVFYLMALTLFRCFRNRSIRPEGQFLLCSLWGPLFCGFYYFSAFGSFLYPLEINQKLAIAEKELYSYEYIDILSWLFGSYSFVFVGIIFSLGAFSLFRANHRYAREIASLGLFLLMWKCLLVVRQDLPSEPRYLLLSLILLLPFSLHFVFSNLDKKWGYLCVALVFSSTLVKSISLFQDQLRKKIEPSYFGIIEKVNHLDLKGRILLDARDFNACFMFHKIRFSPQKLEKAPDRIEKYIIGKYVKKEDARLINLVNYLKLEYVVLEKNYSRGLYNLIESYNEDVPDESKPFSVHRYGGNDRFDLFKIESKDI